MIHWPGLEWETIQHARTPVISNLLIHILRAPVPGGWLLRADIGQGGGLAFIPDPNHEWDGKSLKPEGWTPDP